MTAVRASREEWNALVMLACNSPYVAGLWAKASRVLLRMDDASLCREVCNGAD